MYQTDKIKRVVIKIGTSTLTHENTGRLDLRHLELLARVLSDIKNMGIDVVLVTSGAIGVGMSKLGMTVRPKELRYKQAAASVGQCELMHIYDKFFLDYSQVVGQILITKSDIVEPERRQKVEDTFEALFEVDAIPVVNENDTTGVEEILFGDNDTLSAEVAALVKADLLIIFSDIDGLYDCDPRENENAKIIPRVHGITDEIRALAGGAGTKLGTGGMVTKIHAAEVCFENDIPMVITNGTKIETAYDIIGGKSVGTLFMK
ncbi:MAG: glutamate 5-kinase [Oscillospiraceae bacterium]|nr:glutamate 5-kinase [Oscillospiraceae bacterium]